MKIRTKCHIPKAVGHYNFTFFQVISNRVNKITYKKFLCITILLTLSWIKKKEKEKKKVLSSEEQNTLMECDVSKNTAMETVHKMGQKTKGYLFASIHEENYKILLFSLIHLFRI